MVKRKSLPVRYFRKTLRLPTKRQPPETVPKFNKPNLRTSSIPKIKKPFGGFKTLGIRKPDPSEPVEDNTNQYMQKPRSDLINPMLPNVTRLRMK